jgi:hypothetical protein
MTPTSRGIAKPADHQNEDPAAAAARHLFEAELALHDAHQSHVEAWIAAYGDKLHQAILDHLAATPRAAPARLLEDLTAAVTRVTT